MIILKSDVSINGVQPEIVHAMYPFGARELRKKTTHVAGCIWDKFNKDLVVTSCCEGKHSNNSLHYVGMAFDFRTNDLSASQLKRIKRMLIESLGSDYDFVLEADHGHFEYQPSKGINL